MSRPRVVLVTQAGDELPHPFQAQLEGMLLKAGKQLGRGIKLIQSAVSHEWAVDVDNQPYSEPATFAETVAAL